MDEHRLRNIRPLVIVGLLLLLALNAQAETVEVTARAGLNVRTGPRKVSRKLGALKKGEQVEVLERSANGRWIRVRTPFFDGLDFAPGDAPENALLPGDVADAVALALEARPGTVFDEIVLSPLKKVVRRDPG